ncbi:uncharacterized protein PRCAT00002269001 [Priceomyces carsonii]|uniref:uncharacterized protein n=1 Tax=Priceomyces carsonii TaxID=28549 RepID=UPI002ED9168A|nr:unnamed protein product [Priceomyces carsonii]
MTEDRITAFPDGNSFVKYNSSINKLIIGNSEGLVKVFNVNEPDLEPTSIDILDNLTSIAHHGNQLLITNTDGNLELVDLTLNESKGSIFRSELPLRDSVFINDGKRILCGGDDNKVALIDLQNDNNVTHINVPHQVLNMSYNYSGEIMALSLTDGNIQLYSVVNEVPSLLETIPSILPNKIHTSMHTIDFIDEHKDELVTTKTTWSNNGEFLLVPTSSNAIRVYERSDWNDYKREFKGTNSKIIDFAISPNDKYCAILYLDSSITIFEFNNLNKKIKDINVLLGSHVPINLDWQHRDLYVGTSNGEIVQFINIIDKLPENDLNSLFLNEAEELEGENNTDTLLNDSEAEEERNADNIDKVSDDELRLHEEDSMVIDQDDEIESFAKSNSYYNRDKFLDEGQRKRHKSNGNARHPLFILPQEPNLKPYSPGSTPWKNEKKNASNADRRYLFMNSVGYVWSVKNLSYEDAASQQTITVSFFDRSINKDYHFMDSENYDLCSINFNGLLLGASGYKDGSSVGTIYYRNHEGTQDAWEKRIPLLKNEYITSVAITNNYKLKSENDAVIVVGTNFGYVRFFNVHGVCLNLIKTTPVVTLISSQNNTIFSINQISSKVYCYSILDVNSDFKFIQQDVLLPLKQSPNPEIPLIKGVFFNEYNDPCIVPGIDDTLLILQSWREANNSKWIPLLNCNNTLTEHGTNKNKRHWKCWPLGLYREQLNCLILKNNSQYPDFPLPLPVELSIKLPVSIYQKPIREKGNDILDEADDDATLVNSNEDDPEEMVLRCLTMGKIVSDSLNDEFQEEESEEIMDRLQQYSIVLDKSLLKLFGDACKDYKLKRALSIAKLIKTDRGLSAASKISERMEFSNLANKVSKLREALIDIDNDE